MKYILSVLTGLLLISCGNDQFEKIDSTNFTLELPSSMSTTTELNDEAILQYSNPFSELYTIVIEEDFTSLEEIYPEFFEETENKYSGLIAYSKVALEAYNNTAKNPIELKYTNSTINGCLAVTSTRNFENEGVKIYMKFTFIKGKSHLYQVVSWTLEKNETKYKKDFEKIANSFVDKASKQIDRSKK